MHAFSSKNFSLSSYSIKVFLLLASIALTLLFYSYFSWKVAVVQQAPMLDTIMQARVDLALSHTNLMELVEDRHATIRKSDVSNLLSSAEKLTLQAQSGTTELGFISGSLIKDDELSRRLELLSGSVRELKIHLNAWLHSDSSSINDLGEEHDFLYATAVRHAEQCDERIHQIVGETLTEQKYLFSLLLIIWSGSLLLIWWKWRGVSLKHQKVVDRLRKMSQAIEQSGEVIMITDKRGIVEYVNPAFSRISGYDSEEVLGCHVSILASGKEDRKLLSQLRNTIKQDGQWHGEFEATRKGGQSYPVLMSISPVQNDHNKVTHYVVIQQDISEHAAIEEQLRQSMKMESVGTLVGGIAHDFNNMLTGFMGTLYLMREELGNQTNLIRQVDMLDRMCVGAAKMISQLLTFARRDVVRMQEMEFSAFFSAAADLARSAVPASVYFRVGPLKEEIHILGCEGLLQQVLINLVANAKDAVKSVKHPEIHLSATRYIADASFLGRYPELEGSEFVRLSVSDNGYGIPPEQLNRVFEPFYTTKEVGEGTGLGLAMVYGAVQRHGGVVAIESNPGEITSFHIYLPTTPASRKVTEATSKEIVMGRGETILLVDDDPLVVKTKKALLTTFGYKVLTAYDGAEAVELFTKNRNLISLILMDCVMPKMSGSAAAAEIKQISPEARILYMTGYNDANVLSDELSCSGKRVLFKPCPHSRLSLEIRKALES